MPCSRRFARATLIIYNFLKIHFRSRFYFESTTAIAMVCPLAVTKWWLEWLRLRAAAGRVPSMAAAAPVAAANAAALK